MSIQAVLFDLDGTVLDTLDDLTNAVNHALTSEGFPTHTAESVRAMIGNGIANLIDRALPHSTDREIAARVFSTFKAYYAEHCAVYTKPYDGIMELLSALRAAGVRTALVSNKADFAVKALAKTYFAGLFDSVLGELPTLPRKPAPDMIYHVLDELNVPPSQALFVGDSDTDVLTAANAGVAGIFVTWGFRDRECLAQAGATRFASTPAELAAEILP